MQINRRQLGSSAVLQDLTNSYIEALDGPNKTNAVNWHGHRRKCAIDTGVVACQRALLKPGLLWAPTKIGQLEY